MVTTKLDPRESIELKALLRILNGNQIVSEWSNTVTHLVTPKISFTPKLLLALVNCVPVVSPQFFRDAPKIARDTHKLPPVDKYIPAAIDECPDEYDFSVNESRKTIFGGMSFIFLEETKMHSFQKIITSAGGTVCMWDKKKASIIRVASRVIGESKCDAGDHQDVSKYLLSKGRRLISDSEIGLAIATVSTEKHCNPKYHPDVGHIMALETPYLQVCNSSDLMLVEEIPETICLDEDDDAVDKLVDKTKLRKGVDGRLPMSNTEVPETVANEALQFPDDDDDDFDSRSQQILSLVDQHSSPAPQSQRKRKHVEESDSESPQIKRANSEVNLAPRSPIDSPASQVSSLSGRFDSNQFISRPSQKQTSQGLSQMAPPPPPVTSGSTGIGPVRGKSKRTLADLLAKDDDDSEEELMNFKKKKPKAPVTATEAAKKTVPSLLRAVDMNLMDSASEVDGPTKATPEPQRVQVSQLTDWLSRSLKSSCTINAESLDESRAWIAPLLNSIQVKEFKVDLTNTTRSRTFNTTGGASVVDSSANLSGKRNFKAFKKQAFHRCAIDADLVKTKSVLLTDKL